MLGHNGLFARQLPIAFTCFSHLDILGFCRRQFDLFTIKRFVLQSCVRRSCFTVYKSVISWCSTVNLTIARRVAFRLGMKLTDLLWGDIEQSSHILDPSWTETLPSEIYPKKRRRVHNRDAIFEKIAELLNQRSKNPPPLCEAAKETGASLGYLHYHFPVTVKRITEMHRQREAEHQLEMKKDARAAALDFFTTDHNGIVTLSRKQAFRHIRGEKGLPKHLLRNEINSVYRLLTPPKPKQRLQHG